MATTTRDTSTPPSKQQYDVVIVGAGPAALAVLSSIQSPYSLDQLSPDKVYLANRHLPGSECRGSSVLVVDTAPEWMAGWSRNFKALDIQFLRSPVMAHPDMFDMNSLLAFAELQGRTNELVESGCGSLKSLIPLGQSQIGLWKLPSLKLFTDFCQDLAGRLPHEYHQSCVTNICMEKEGGSAPLFEVTLGEGHMVKATAVVLAMGSVGTPVIPKPLKNICEVSSKIISWTDLDKAVPECGHQWKKALVIGGGLTAVQAAQRLATTKAKVTLCSRRPLFSKHFDLAIEWFDRRTATKCMSDFYHQAHSDRLAMLKETRGGGSIPEIYMKALRKLEQEGRVVRRVGSIVDAEMVEDTVQVTIEQPATGKQQDYHYDIIVLACGIQPDCEKNPLLQKLLQQWPLDVKGGFPCLTEDLEWTQRLHAVGGLASLSVGPDAANLMGMRRAAQIVSNSLDCRCWLREEEVLKNPFTNLMWSDSDSDSDSDCAFGEQRGPKAMIS